MTASRGFSEDLRPPLGVGVGVPVENTGRWIKADVVELAREECSDGAATGGEVMIDRSNTWGALTEGGLRASCALPTGVLAVQDVGPSRKMLNVGRVDPARPPEA